MRGAAPPVSAKMSHASLFVPRMPVLAAAQASMADISVGSALTNAYDWLTHRDSGLLTPSAEADRGRLSGRRWPTLGAIGHGMALAFTPNRAYKA